MDPGVIVGLSVGTAVLVILILVFGCKFARKDKKDKDDIAKEKLLGSRPVHRQRSDTSVSSRNLKYQKDCFEKATKNHKQKPDKRTSVTFDEKTSSGEPSNNDLSNQRYSDYAYYCPSQRPSAEYLLSGDSGRQMFYEYVDGLCQVDEVLKDSKCTSRKTNPDRGSKDYKTDKRRQTSLKTVIDKIGGKRADKHRRKYQDEAETREEKKVLKRQSSVKQMLEDVKRNSKLSMQSGTRITLNCNNEDNDFRKSSTSETNSNNSTSSKIDADKAYFVNQQKSGKESSRVLLRPRESIQTVKRQISTETPSHRSVYRDYERHTLRQDIDRPHPENETCIIHPGEISSDEASPKDFFKPQERSQVDPSLDMESPLTPVKHDSFTEALSAWQVHNEKSVKIPRPRSSTMYTISRQNPQTSYNNIPVYKVYTKPSFRSTSERETVISHHDSSRRGTLSTSTEDDKNIPEDRLPKETLTYQLDLPPPISPQGHSKMSNAHNEKQLSPSADLQLHVYTQLSPKSNPVSRAQTPPPKSRVSPVTNRESRSPGRTLIVKHPSPKTNIPSPVSTQTERHKQHSPVTYLPSLAPQQSSPNALLPTDELQETREPQETPQCEHPVPNVFQQAQATLSMNRQQVPQAQIAQSSLRKKISSPGKAHNPAPILLQTKPSPKACQQEPIKEQLKSIPIEQLSSMTADPWKKPSTFIPVEHKIEQHFVQILAENTREQPSTRLSAPTSMSVQSTTCDNITTISKQAEKKSPPCVESRPEKSQLVEYSIDKINKDLNADELSDSIISKRKNLQDKDSLDLIKSESEFNPGQTSTPNQSKTEVPGIATDEFKPSQTSTPNQSKTGVHGIVTDDFKPGQTSTPNQSKTGAPGIATDEFKPDQTSTPQQSANCETESNRSILHSILRKRREVIAVSSQDLSGFQSDVSFEEDTILQAGKASSEDCKLSPAEAVKQSERSVNVVKEYRVSGILPEKLATVKEIRKDPDINAILTGIKEKKRSSANIS